MAEAAWLEISLTVNGEMAEAVAEVMSRYIPSGIVIESTEIVETADHSAQVVGDLRVVGYLNVDDQTENSRHKIEEALWHLGQIQPLPPPTFKQIQETNWMEGWKKHYKPIPVGKRLMILPPWFKNPDLTRIPIKIDPGMAFGTGVHPTTQLSLLLLEEHIRPGDSVFDIGCGSGILSIASHKLGAEMVFGIDIDSGAVEISQKNTLQNEIKKGVIFKIGSLEEIKNDIFPIQQANIVVANILSHILIKLLDQGLDDLVSSEGFLLLSGILTEKEPEILNALEEHNLVVDHRIQMDDWVAFKAKKPRR